MIRLLILCLAVVCLAAPASGMSRKPKFTLSFHAQGSDMESPRSIFRYAIPGHAHPLVFKRVPEITHGNIAAYHDFPTPNGNGRGLSLRLDFRGTGALEMVTRSRRGEVLLAMINGSPVDYLTIDKPVSDGIITIWEGVPETVIAEIKKKHPPIKELRSMSSGQDMLPTTRAEKKRALEEAEERRKEEAQKAKEDARKSAQPTEPVPTGDNGLPRGPLSERLPVEGQIDQQGIPLPLIKR
jgi:hypothetical protein